jgi:hypothetical protein
MNNKAFLLFFTIFITAIFLTSCSKDERAKATDKVLGRTSPSPSSAPMRTSGAPAHTTPAVFMDLLEQINTLTADANTFVSQYYPDPASQSSFAQALRQRFDALPSHISEAIRLLCININDGSSTLDFHDIPVYKSTISGVISKFEECLNALSTANDALNTFCTDDPVLINMADVFYLSNIITNLSTSISDNISQLRDLQSRL